MAKLTSAFLVIISVVLSLACQSKPRQSYPDHSLVASAYVQKGLPAYDRVWIGEDYRQAGVVLRGVAATDAAQLPRYDSPTSGAIFARLVSRENLRHFDDNERLLGLASLCQNIPQVMGVYTSATTGERLFDTELVELKRYEIEVSYELVQLASKYRMIDNSDAPLPRGNMDDDEVKLREKTQRGLAGVFDESLTLLANRDIRSAERIRLAETLETTLPAMISYFPPAAQPKTSFRIQRMFEQEADADVKQRLGRIVGALKK